MNRIEPLLMQPVSNAQVVIIRMVGGEAGKDGDILAFQVWDLDCCEQLDPDSGALRVQVQCSLGDGPLDSDEVLDLHAAQIVARVHGFDGEVVRRVRLTSSAR